MKGHCMKTYHFSHKVLNISIELINYVDYITDELMLLLSYSFNSDDGNIVTTEHMEIIEKCNGYIYIWNGRTYYNIETKDELFWILNEVICGEIFTIQDEWLLLHAAAISYKGNVLAFVADSNTGKSTFSSVFSMHEGCEYITDDLLPIRKSDLLCCDFHKSIAIRENSEMYAQSFKNCLSTDIFIKYNDSKKRMVFPKNCSCFHGPKAIKAFVFLNRNNNYTSNSLHMLSKNIALSKMIKSFIFSEMSDIPTATIRLVQNNIFFQLNYSGVESIDKDGFLNEII